MLDLYIIENARAAYPVQSIALAAVRARRLIVLRREAVKLGRLLGRLLLECLEVAVLLGQLGDLCFEVGDFFGGVGCGFGAGAGG